MHCRWANVVADGAPRMVQQQRQVTHAPITSDVCAECSAIVATQGLRSAIEFLNRRTRFRFTGLYRVEPPHLCNVLLYDRENPDMNVSGAVATLDDTYCSLTYLAGPFATVDAQADSRLTSHPSRDAVISYAGVPLRLANGHVWGTLCHYDVRPRLLSEPERSVLEMVAPVLLASLQPGETLSAATALARPGSVVPRT